MTTLSTPLSKRLAKPLAFPRPNAWWGGIFAALALGLALQADPGLPDRAFAATITALKPARPQGTVSALTDYRVSVEARPVAGVTRGLSGLAWDAQRNHLWAVGNEPPQLLALDARGEVLARHPLAGFHDLAGVAVLGDGRLLLAEAHQSLVVAPVPAGPDAVLSRDSLPTLTLAPSDGIGSGIAGIAYNEAGDRLFVTEHAPRGLHEIRDLRASLAGQGDAEIIDREAWLRGKLLARDLSSVQFDPRTGHLLLLSAASRLALEIDTDGRQIGYQELGAGFAGLAESVPQAAGIALDGRGSLYVVGAPGLFYAFRPE
ncbi:DNA-binding protein [Aromatoleum toluvorans]|uniref:DNA-binding protein n=1 Tax=Aromatoleum toluvorans TaxID=92002 RepID=A0ABX1Q5W3_9RHOO|nr:SdiA-regulated domain-containing protein [Aromatoleum toluvorans]NMG46282.1 DNA-binding protein [Aromatoleum toluvorans]